jgi:pimeloyl-ACP methyl ester carboxylesterase
METMTSSDGTAISVLSTGTGPGLVVLPGTTRRAYHYAALAAALGKAYTVHTVDRRGRGASGPQGPDYRIEREVEDALAVLDATGASIVFGHSYGGLIALELARHRPLSSLLLYEPPVSGLDATFLPSLTAAVDDGRYGRAMAELLVGLQLVPPRVPMFAFATMGWLMMRGREGAALRETMRTVPAEIREGARLDPDLSRYAEITTPTLLLGGGRSPAWLPAALPKLQRVLPNAQLVVSPGLDHNAPDENAPATVAGLMRAFLTPVEAMP